MTFRLGGGYPQIPLRKKSAKKTAIFGQKTPILALFDPFFKENFRQFSVKVKGGGGYPPIPLRKKSAKKQLFLAKNRLF